MVSSGPHIVGRYALYDAFASGGMATVHGGRLLGPAGFSRTVAIKRLHAQFARDPEFVSMFLDEARTAARIRHPNVVPTLDVVARDGELFIVMDFVHGESLARLIRTASVNGRSIPIDIVSAIMCGALHGLHAAHEASDDRGEPLNIVHRDVSPQNILVDAEGVARVVDFGVAKAARRLQSTRNGELKGKLGYMAPEQLRAGVIDRRLDIFAAGIVLWEALTLRRLFGGDNEGAIVTRILEGTIARPSSIDASIPRSLDEVTLRALQRDRTERFATAREMALALEGAVPVASPSRVSRWIEELAGDVLAARARSVADMENDLPVALPGGIGSSATDTSETLATKVARPRRVMFAFGVLCLAVAGVVAFTREHHPTISASAPASSDEVAPPPSAPPEAHPTPSQPPPQPPSSPAPRTAHPPPPAPHPAPHPARAKPCRIKSYVDESGIKHFVEECK